ncbi:hypothetical protein BDD12DRAFT_803776 [Trichophaea hybrida]|nr:hypothetical protein BDD12DRAFT_803776 [Trichophaea hybrida]
MCQSKRNTKNTAEAVVAQRLYYQFSDGAQGRRIITREISQLKNDLITQGIYTTFAGKIGFANDALIGLLAEFLRGEIENFNGELDEAKFGTLHDALWNRRTTKAADEPLSCFTILEWT